MSEDNLKVVTIIGDSLSMVRPDCQLTLKSLYPYQLQTKLGKNYYVVVRNRRANHTNTQCQYQHLHDDILYNDSDYIIFHLGIVDCAPRLITRLERLIFRLFRVNTRENIYIRFKSRYRRFFTRYFPFQRVTKRQFQDNFEKLISLIREQTATKKIFILNIADTNEYNKHRSFNYAKNIEEYNGILADLVNSNSNTCCLIDVNSWSLNKEIMLDDGMHINKKGHELIASVLYEGILNAENSCSKYSPQRETCPAENF